MFRDTGCPGNRLKYAESTCCIVQAGCWAEITLVEPDLARTNEGNVVFDHAVNTYETPPGDRFQAPRTNRVSSRISNPIRRLLSHCYPWITSASLLLIWALASAGGQESTLPSPGAVLLAARDLSAQGLLLPSIGASAPRVVIASAIAIVIAVPSGILSGISKLGSLIIDKPIHMLRAVPFNALAPLLIVWLGIGETLKIVLIAIGVFSPIYLNLRDGVRQLDPKLLELARAYRIPPKDVFIDLLLKGSIPSLITGLRFGLTISWIALVTCETVNSSTGIGYLLSRSQQFSRNDQMVLCIVMYAFLALITESLMSVFEKLATPWASRSSFRLIPR